MADNIITLNVGGTIFTTTRETLCKFDDSVLKAMFSTDQLMQAATKDSNGNYFLDRNPVIFSHILDMCRNGKIPQVITDKVLRKEVKYWFPGIFTKTEDEIMLKNIAQGICDDLITDRRYVECCNEFQKVILIPNVPDHRIIIASQPKNQNKKIIEGVKGKELLVKIWREYADNWDTYFFDGKDLVYFCLVRALLPDQVKYITDSESEEDIEKKDIDYIILVDRLFHMLENDNAFFERALNIWNHISNISQKLLHNTMLDSLCHLINKKLPCGYNAIFLACSHQCDHDFDINHRKIILPNGKNLPLDDNGDYITTTQNLFYGVNKYTTGTAHMKLLEKWCPISYISCQCGNSKFNRILHSTDKYICIYRTFENELKETDDDTLKFKEELLSVCGRIDSHLKSTKDDGYDMGLVNTIDYFRSNLTREVHHFADTITASMDEIIDEIRSMHVLIGKDIKKRKRNDSDHNLNTHTSNHINHDPSYNKKSKKDIKPLTDDEDSNIL